MITDKQIIDNVDKYLRERIASMQKHLNVLVTKGEPMTAQAMGLRARIETLDNVLEVIGNEVTNQAMQEIEKEEGYYEND